MEKSRQPLSLTEILQQLTKTKKEGVQQTLINQLYLHSTRESGPIVLDEIEFFLPQLVNIYIYHSKGNNHKFSALERYLLEQCTQSVHFALTLGFLVDAETKLKPMRPKIARMRTLIEQAVINKMIPLSEITQLDRGEMDLQYCMEKDSLERQKRLIYFNKQIAFIQFLIDLTRRLLLYPMGKMRTERLRLELNHYNSVLPDDLYFPLQKSSEKRKRIVKICAKECFAISTKERVPSMIFFECIEDDTTCAKPLKPPKFSRRNHKRSVSMIAKVVTPKVVEESKDDELEVDDDLDGFEVVNVRDTRKDLLKKAFGESWADRSQRIKSNSSYGYHPGWSLESLIAKSNDDIRQEHLTMQVISLLKKIWIEEDKLPIHMTTYQFLVTSPDSGCIETLKDCCSLDRLMKTIPDYTCLLDYFTMVYGPVGSNDFDKAQLHFIESMAAYSVICYLLQIKDRHNGNIMIHRDGYIVHIDYGFLMSNSPMKGIGFETAPFKMTEEFAQVIGGTKKDPVNTTMFRHFRMLIYVLMRSATKNVDRICNLLETMFPASLTYPCFQSQKITGKAGHIMKAFRERFKSKLDEDKYAKFTKKLIDTSLNNSRTLQYDSFQWMTNGIQYRP